MCGPGIVVKLEVRVEDKEKGRLVKPLGLREFIKFLATETEKSKEVWAPELERYCELVDKYQILTSSMKIDNHQVRLPARLLLEVESEMYGVGVQLLQRRITAAMMETRRAIEATGIAYRVWKKPSLVEVFYKAYPWADQDNHPKQWKPSEDYKKEFNTYTLFGEEGEVWKTLKVGYQLLSAMATHAGPGVLTTQEILEGYYFSHFVETSDKEVRRGWYYSMTMFFQMLRVFLTILRQSVPPAIIAALERDIITWRDTVAVQMDKRTPWIDPTETTPSPLGLIIRPDQIRFLLSYPTTPPDRSGG